MYYARNAKFSCIPLWFPKKCNAILDLCIVTVCIMSNSTVLAMGFSFLKCLFYALLYLHLFTGLVYLSCLVDGSMSSNAYLYLILLMSICWLSVLTMPLFLKMFISCLTKLATTYRTPICLGCLFHALLY
jgi:hypothetical protein